MASGNPEDSDALSIRANARVVAATIKAGHSADYQIAEGRKVYLVAATGAYSVNGVAAKARDGVAISDTQTISVSASEDTEIVLVDVE